MRHFLRQRSIRSAGGLALALSLILLASVASAHASSQGQTVTKERVEAMLRQYVLERSAWKPENVEVRLVALQPISVPLGELNLRVIRPNQSLPSGLNSFLVGVDVAGKEEARLWIKSEIKVFDDVVVSSVPLAHHEVINA